VEHRGVVTRHLDSARSFEVTFWRSLFNALALAVALGAMRGAALWKRLVRAPGGMGVWRLLVGDVHRIMVAITLTTVANVLITMAIGPLVTALFARLFLDHRLPPRPGHRSRSAARALPGYSARSSIRALVRGHAGRARGAGRRGDQLDHAAAHRPRTRDPDAAAPQTCSRRC